MTSQIVKVEDHFLFMDERGDLWRLQPTCDPGMPLQILLMERLNYRLSLEERFDRYDRFL